MTATSNAPVRLPHAPPVVLVVDDDRTFNTRLCRALADRGWDAHSALDGDAAIQFARSARPDLAIVDLRLPGMNGLDLIQKLHQVDRKICIIMLTGYGNIATALTATKLGASHYMSKPVDADQILEAYERIQETESTTEFDENSVPSLAMVEWDYMQRVLAGCNGNVTQAAKLLGLHRRSLQRKLSKYPPKK
ncbi:MAG TPA: response regulator [Bryobacteraceae bacterium]|nr:response regulator [Bryobacteraceae bacterium]